MSNRSIKKLGSSSTCKKHIIESTLLKVNSFECYFSMLSDQSTHNLDKNAINVLHRSCIHYPFHSYNLEAFI